ncbi:uncharacterized protein LOC123537082 isoform X2 [Mercenaria mercenaria]|uniref:uncharacterized protein LOC123537082 isoform X2 n=1 Tax=Mercenaria mercenaria TaxID=6596 RepID=UPI00234F21DA|nr:uncharacterized protein LOC123537082 isoform X2 [Mercenaria mercenaria]
MFRQFCKKVISLERSTNLQRCLRANYCSSLGQDEMETVDMDEDSENSLHKEFSFCHVTMLGRVGVKPKLIETESSHSFVSFLIGVDPAQDNTKWHEVQVNSDFQKKKILKDIDVGDRVYVSGRLSYILAREQYVKKYKIYSDYVRLVSHSKKFWDQRLESEDKAGDDSDIEK